MLGASIATVITVLVNGRAITRTVFRRDGKDSEESREYWIEINSEGGRTKIATDGQDVLRVSGRVSCNKPDVDTYSITRGMEFSVAGSNCDWVVFGQVSMTGDAKVVPLSASPPSDDATLSPGGLTLTVSALVEGRSLSGPLALTLEEAGHELVIEPAD